MRYLFSLFVVLFALNASQAFADDSAQAKAYVDGVTKEATTTIQLAQTDKITNEQAKEKFRKILQESFDIPTIAKFTMGRYWRVATPAEQQEFTRLLQTVILNKYADRLLESSDNTYVIKSASAINEKDYGVTMSLTPKGKPPVAFSWRLRKSASGFKVIDIGVEGVSMSVTHRTDFANVIERNGGKVQALIDALKDKESPLVKS